MIVKALWILSLAAFLFALHPIAVAYVGLQINHDAMKTYHWMAVIFTPVGLVVGFIAGLAALLIQISRRSSKKRPDSTS